MRPGLVAIRCGALTFALDLWTGILIYDAIGISHEVHQQTLNRAARQDFVLERDFQYGELWIPAGSQIQRYDPFDNGEKDLPLALRGLRAVHFPHPLQVAENASSRITVGEGSHHCRAARFLLFLSGYRYGGIPPWVN